VTALTIAQFGERFVGSRSEFRYRSFGDSVIAAPSIVLSRRADLLWPNGEVMHDDLGHLLRHAGLGGLASAFDPLGQIHFGRT
jgi:hypothetical protein